MSIDDPKRIRDLAVAEIVVFIRSEGFPVRAALSELIPLMDAVTRPPDEEAGGSQFANAPVWEDLPEKSDCYISLRKAVSEAA
jgi:hypothetical protein